MGSPTTPWIGDHRLIIKYANPQTVAPGSDVIYTTVIPADKELAESATANLFDKFPDFDLLGQLGFDGSILVPEGSAPAKIDLFSGVVSWSGDVNAKSFVQVKYALKIPADLPIVYCGAELSAGGQVSNGVDAAGGIDTTVTINCPPSE